MTLLVKVYLLVIAAVGGSCIKIAWMAGRPTDLFLAVGMIFFMNLTYEGLMHIHIRVWNPLGLDRNDFPSRRYMDFVWAATHQVHRKCKIGLPRFCVFGSGNIPSEVTSLFFWRARKRPPLCLCLCLCLSLSLCLFSLSLCCPLRAFMC